MMCSFVLGCFWMPWIKACVCTCHNPQHIRQEDIFISKSWYVIECLIAVKGNCLYYINDILLRRDLWRTRNPSVSSFAIWMAHCWMVSTPAEASAKRPRRSWSRRGSYGLELGHSLLGFLSQIRQIRPHGGFCHSWLSEYCDDSFDDHVWLSTSRWARAAATL